MKSLPNEELLISKASKGDNEAFQKIMLHYLGLISKISSQYQAEGYEKGDFEQEGLVGLLSAVRTYKSDYGTSFRNYAMRCVKNRLYTVVKKASAEKVLTQQGTVSIEDVEITDDSINPESLVLYQESLAYLFERAKAKLSAKEYSVLTLYAKGYTYKEISALLGISKKSVDNALARAKKKLL